MKDSKRLFDIQLWAPNVATRVCYKVQWNMYPRNNANGTSGTARVTQEETIMLYSVQTKNAEERSRSRSSGPISRKLTIARLERESI